MSASEPPLVTIVTPSYNMRPFLAAAVDSVLAQDYPCIEYLVMDGGSTDGTVEYLESHRERLSYISAPDRGPADALRRGFRQAHGEIFAWLNADDTYQPGAVRRAVEYLQAHPEVDVVYGEGCWVDEHGTAIRRYPTQPFDARVLERDCIICQPTAFFRASAYRQCELDASVRPSFDYDLWIRMAKAGFRFAAIPQHLANSRMHRGTLTLGQRDAVFQSSMTLLQRHYGYVPLSWVFGYAAYRIDRRDQFFAELRPTPWKYLAALPLGLRWNRQRPFRFLAEWLATPIRLILRSARRWFPK